MDDFWGWGRDEPGVGGKFLGELTARPAGVTQKDAKSDGGIGGGAEDFFDIKAEVGDDFGRVRGFLERGEDDFLSGDGASEENGKMAEGGETEIGIKEFA